MGHTELLIFLSMVALGSYIQTVTGFALGLVVMGAVTLLGLAPVAFSAVVVSILALVNSFLAMQRDLHQIHWPSARTILIGMLPAVAVGLALLHYLSAYTMQGLKSLLGGFIIASGLLLVYKPHPRPEPAGNGKALIAGMIGGLFGGLFSTGGPPVVYHLYRQPLPVVVVRTTLLAVFTIATVVRITYVAIYDGIGLDVLHVSAWSLPVVIGTTLLGRRYRPPLSDLNMRRLAFTLLVLLGLSLLVPVEWIRGA